MTAIVVSLLCVPAATAEGGDARETSGIRVTGADLGATLGRPCPPGSKPVRSGCIPKSAAHVVRGERCKSARKAVSHYRALTWERQQARGGALADRTPIVRGRSCRWARYAAREHAARAKAALASLERWQKEQRRIPRGEAEIRAYVNDACLEEIIRRETAGTWSPTIWNGQGSGAYGLPQALPAYKMASAGSDWRTNPKTQIRWMRGYVNGRYGGSCSALAFHNANGWY